MGFKGLRLLEERRGKLTNVGEPARITPVSKRGVREKSHVDFRVCSPIPYHLLRNVGGPRAITDSLEKADQHIFKQAFKDEYSHVDRLKIAPFVMVPPAVLVINSRLGSLDLATGYIPRNCLHHGATNRLRWNPA